MWLVKKKGYLTGAINKKVVALVLFFLKINKRWQQKNKYNGIKACDFFSSKSKNKTITKNKKDGSTYTISREPIYPKKRIKRERKWDKAEGIVKE